MADAQQPQTGYAAVNGAKLYYEMAGSGHPLVLVHGGLVDCRMWDDQFNVFAQHYRVVRYDLRGYGRSDFPAGSYSNSEDLYGLLTFLGMEKAHLMGLSLGGRVAIDFALEHPEMVTTLIPVASGLSGYKFADNPLDAEAEAAYKRGDFAQAAELVARIWVDGPNRAPDQVDARVRERTKAMLVETYARPEPQGGYKLREADPPAIKRLREIQAPTLIIVGEQDVLDILVIADLLQKHIARADTLVIPGAAHMVNMEQPGKVNQAVLDFLRS